MKSAPLLLSASAIAVGIYLSSPASSQTAMPVKRFRTVELRGGGHIILRPGAAQRVTLLEGSTKYTRFRVRNDGQLLIDACYENCPHAYNLEIEIVTPASRGVAIDGGESIESERGFGPQASIGAAIQGGGHIDIRSIDVEHADAAVDGGGHIAVRAEHSLEAAVNGSGNVSYWGNPAVTSAIDGGGSISRGG